MGCLNFTLIFLNSTNLLPAGISWRRRGGGGGRSEAFVGAEKRLPIEGHVTRLRRHHPQLCVGGDHAVNLWTKQGQIHRKIQNQSCAIG